MKKSVVDLLWVASPKVASGGLQVATNLLIVQQLGPERAGVVFVCVTAILLADAVFGSALDLAVVRLATSQTPGTTSSGPQVQKAALAIKTVACLLLAVVVALWSRQFSGLLFHAERDAPLLLLSVVAFFGLLVVRSLQTWFQVAGHFRAYGLTDLLHSALRFGGIGALFALDAMSPLALLTLFAVVPLALAGAVLSGSSAGAVIATPLSRPAVHDVRTIAAWYLGAAALASINTRVDLLFVSAVAGPAQAGLFAAAQLFVQPFQLLGMYLGVVLAPRVLPLWEGGGLASLYIRMQIAAGVVSAVVFFAAIAGADRIADRLLPASYDGTATIALVLLPSALLALLNFPITVSFLMFTHQRMLVVLEGCALPLLVLLYREMVAAYGAAGAAAVTSGYAIVKTAIYQVVAGRAIRRPARPHRAPFAVLASGVPDVVAQG